MIEALYTLLVLVGSVVVLAGLLAVVGRLNDD